MTLKGRLILRFVYMSISGHMGGEPKEKCKSTITFKTYQQYEIGNGQTVKVNMLLRVGFMQTRPTLTPI